MFVILISGTKLLKLENSIILDEFKATTHVYYLNILQYPILARLKEQNYLAFLVMKLIYCHILAYLVNQSLA